MGRRSRSPKRERRRSRDRERDRDRDRERKVRRSRSRSPRRRRSRSPVRRRSPDRRFDRDRERERERGDKDKSRTDEPPKKKKNPPNAAQLATRPPLDASAFIGKSEEEVSMMTIMGFGTFDSTKGKHVPGNDVGDAHIVEKRRYRQYMNRRGGFNRPLDPIA